MNRKASVLSVLPTLALVLGAFSCQPETTPSSVHAGEATVAETDEPTTERVIERCSERWAKIVAAGEDPSIWVEIYEYETPAQKANLSLPSFLSNKDKYIYDSPAKPRVLLIEDDIAYVDMAVHWLAGRHPMIRSASIGGDPNRVEPMDLIETWQWINGDWHFVRPDNKSEFLRVNPDFLARAQKASQGLQK